MPRARQEVSSAVLNGKIYVIGGYDGARSSTNLVEVYNPNTNLWSAARRIPVSANHNSAAVAAGKLYTFGAMEKRAFVYDEPGDSWSAIANSKFTHGDTAAVGVINDKIYVAGGSGGTQRDLEVYDPAANTWTVLASMSVPRNHCAGAVINGKFYVVGGRSVLASPTALKSTIRRRTLGRPSLRCRLAAPV